MSLTWSVTSQSDWEAGTLSDGVEADSSPGDLRLGYKDGSTGDSRQLFYRMDETSGAVVDSSGEGDDGTANTVNRGATGILGTNAFEFIDTSTSEQVDTNSKVLSDLDKLTLLAWVKTSSTTKQSIITNQASDTGPSIVLEINNQKVRGVVDLAGGGNAQGVFGTSDVVDGTWHLIGMSFDEPNDTVEIWVDASMENSDSNITNAPSINDVADFFLGNSFFGGVPLIGFADSVIIENKVLSQSEWTALYEGTNPLSETFGGEYESEWHDFGNTVSFNTFTTSSTLNSQTVNYTVRVSDDGGSTTLGSPVTGSLSGGTDNIDISGLTDARYVQVELELSTTDVTASPEVQDYTVTVQGLQRGDDLLWRTTSGEWKSAWHNFGKTVSFQKFTATETLNSQTITYQFRSSSDGTEGTASAFKNDITNVPNDQYLQVKASFSTSDSSVTPELHKFDVEARG